VGDVQPKDALTELRNAIAGKLSSLQISVEEAIRTTEALTRSTETEATAISESIAAHDRRYSEAIAQNETLQGRLNVIKTLSDEIAEAQKERDTLRAQIESFGDTTGSLATARHDWLRLLASETALMEREAASLAAASGEQLRVAIRKRVNVESLKEHLQDAVKGAGLTVPEKINRLFEKVSTSDNPLTSWLEVTGELQALARAAASLSSGAELPATPRLAEAQFIETEVRRIALKLTPSAAIELSLNVPTDVPAFEYRSEQGSYVPFETASPGQQATALIGLLMSQRGGPLVIDQPEDDLDNATISKIAERLWTAKEARQVIFVSHNPNLVVIGDAELVLRCDYQAPAGTSAVRIADEGAIDDPKMNKVIANVIEGGEQAFSLRKAKYGF
jgi:type III restriction enzyme